MALKIRRRLEDGTFGPEEELFASEETAETVAMFEAIVIQQEMLAQMQAEIEALKAEKGGVV